MLGVALLLVYFAARAILLRVGESRRSIAFACTLAILATAPAFFDTLGTGLVVTSAVFALPALSVLWTPVFNERPQGWIAMVAIVVFVVLTSWVALTTYLWDEGSTHFGVSSAIARGVLSPVEHPLFPGEPFAYHVGYDVLAGLVRHSLGVAPDVACDVVTIACLITLALLLAEIGGWLAVVVVPLGYGPFAAFLAEGWGAFSAGSLFPKAWVGAPQLPPPVVSNLFQHPQGLGLPIACAALLLFADRPSTKRLAIAAVLLALMSQIQVVLFFVLGLALGVAVVMERNIQIAPRLLLLAVAGVVGLKLGGLASGVGDALVFGRGYFKEGAVSLIAHHLVLFGASLVAVAAALLLPKTPLRVALMISATTCFIIANVATYTRSWDVVKFFAIGCFLGNILLADLLRTYWSRARTVCVIVLVISTWSAGFWLLRHGPLNGVVAFAYTEHPPDALALRFDREVGHLIGARERILTSHGALSQLGFLVVGADWRRGGSGYLLNRERMDEERDRARRALATMDRDALDALEVDIIVDKRVLPGFTEIGVVDGWRVYRVRP